MRAMTTAGAAVLLLTAGASEAGTASYITTTFLFATDKFDQFLEYVIGDTGQGVGLPLFDDQGGTRTLQSVEVTALASWLSFGAIQCAGVDSSDCGNFQITNKSNIFITPLPNGLSMSTPANADNDTNPVRGTGPGNFTSSLFVQQAQSFTGVNFEDVVLFGAPGSETACGSIAPPKINDPANPDAAIIAILNSANPAISPPLPCYLLNNVIVDETYGPGSPNFASWIGAGYFGMDVDTITGFSVQGGGTNTNISLRTDLYVDVTVTYTYDDVPVPAPVALLGLGLGLLGAVRRRLHRA